MCGRYSVTRNENIVEEMQATLELSARTSEWWKPRYNVAPTQPAPVVLTHDNARSLALLRWGLIPHWAGHDGKKAPLMINARAESLPAKQDFRDALAHKRCLVPADGFFEWVRDEHKKKPPQPFYFHPADHDLFAFAGLWARTHDDHGAPILSYTIITTRASDLVRPIHDRMPVVLPRADWDAWLDPSTDASSARDLLAHAATHAWTREPVSTWVNKADHDDPRCIAPAEPAPQATLL